MEFKFKTQFYAEAKVLEAGEDMKKQAFASLQELKSLMPADFNPEQEPDLLYIASPLVLVGKCNLNGDCLSKETALAYYTKFAKKLLDIEHNREKIIGNIFNVALTEVDSNRILTMEEAFQQDFFNISYAAYLWKVANPKLAEFLQMASKEKSPYYNSVSSSFEVGFDEYSIAVGSRDLKNARIITKAEQESYEPYLTNNGGKGVNEKGELVYRVLDKKITPLGAGLVSRPASQVKGVLTIEKLMANIDPTQTVGDDEDDTDADMDDADAKLLEDVKHAVEATDNETLTLTRKDGTTVKATFTRVKVEAAPEQNKEQIAASLATEDKILSKNDIQIKNDGVITNTAKPMKITKLEDIQANSAELFKNETYATDIAKLIADETARISEEYVKKMKESEATAKFLSEAKAASEAKAKELETKAAELEAKVAELAAKLNEIEEAKAAEVAERLFQERMVGLEAEFDLNDEARAFITTDIKGLTEEQFAAYAKKAQALFKKKAKKCDDGDKDDSAKASVNLQEAVASAKPDETQGGLPNSTTPPEETLAERMKKAFSSENVKLNGKEIKASVKE